MVPEIAPIAARFTVVGVPANLVILRSQKGATAEILKEAAVPETMALNVPPVTL
jgi:hypothetical protein